MTASPWQLARVSPDGTHHCVDECPLYEKRFFRVLSFHAPGLAAVHDGHAAYHIDACGNRAYSHVFIDAFGFYENLAAVQTEEGCFHITPDGAPAYDSRYVWCGNFQGGFAVVLANSGYFIFSPMGKRYIWTVFCMRATLESAERLCGCATGFVRISVKTALILIPCAIMIWMFIIKGLRVLGMSVDGHT